MIRYSLTCPEGHGFDSWFQSAEAFDRLAAAGHVACALCGSTRVEKSLMAPAVQPARSKVSGSPASESAPLATPASPAEQALAALRRQVEENSDYVGLSFASEARAMHEGDIPQRPIYGEAKAEEARALLADGIPVAPLPFIPARKTN